MRVKPSVQLTLKDRLSRLTLVQAQKLLGPDGAQLLAKGGAIDVDLATQVVFSEERLQVTFPDARARRAPAVVTVALDDAHRNRLRVACNHSGAQSLLHQAATLALILEEKTALGLAAAPEEDTPWELLPESELESRALAERAKRAAEEAMKVKAMVPATPWTDYTVASALSGKTYRVALRGMERGQSYCSCPDFRKNLLGTCKHVLKVQAWAKQEVRGRRAGERRGHRSGSACSRATTATCAWAWKRRRGCRPQRSRSRLTGGIASRARAPSSPSWSRRYGSCRAWARK